MAWSTDAEICQNTAGHIYQVALNLVDFCLHNALQITDRYYVKRYSTPQKFERLTTQKLLKWQRLRYNDQGKRAKLCRG